MESLVNKDSLKSKLILQLLMIVSVCSIGQYAPSAGEIGTTAMYKDSSAFVGWAISCDSELGLQDVSNSALGAASVGTDESVIGEVTGLTLSLGDGGSAVVQFSDPIKNGTGPDFAIFENSFSDTFLELAFVEVSSDGVNYVRFPASSLSETSSQVAGFGALEAVKINNLAGKYIGSYGTPFDLEELIGEAGVDVNAITHVKIIDVVGSVNTLYASYDAAGNAINDPWPTPFPSSGFDLDAVGVINSASTSIFDIAGMKRVIVYPNPVSSQFSVRLPEKVKFVKVYDLSGILVLKSNGAYNISTRSLNKGIYFVKVETVLGVYSQKITVKDE